MTDAGDVRRSRREFLGDTARATAAAAIGLGGLAASCSDDEPGKKAVSRAFPEFDHLVVLMLENRSFDNMLGFLYEPGAVPRGQTFEGVAGKNLSNPGPDGPVHVVPGTVMHYPKPDPGEEYPHVNTQLFGTVDPEGNAFKLALQMEAPYNTPARIPTTAPMNGFVRDYINDFTQIYRRAPTFDEYRIILNCFPPEAVPVISTLAREFAVCDHWFCEVPSQTFCNRSFFHAGTSSGFVTNEPYERWPERNGAETLFNRLDAAGVSWRIYFDPEDHFSLTAVIHFQRLFSRFKTNIRHMADFITDASEGRLPKYSFIEPRLFFNHNDQHPPAALLTNEEQHSSVLAGEELIAQVYDAIRTSASPSGSNWSNTAFLLTYDEHGGCYDHLPPPGGPRPDLLGGAGQMDFRFDRLGVRVPAVFVSAHTRAGTVVNDPLRHTAVIRTMSQKWGLRHLTERDRTAPDLSPFLNLGQPRPPSEWPTVTPRPWSPAPDYASLELNSLQKSMLFAAEAAIGTGSGTAAGARTVGDAVSLLRTWAHQAL